MKNDYILISRNTYEAVKDVMSDAERLETLDNITAYAFDGRVPSTFSSPIVKAAFIFMRIEVDKQRDPARIRVSAAYKRFREAVIERDENTCQICGASFDIMHVHHVKRFADYPELRFEVDNAITLCPACHRSIHYGEK